MDKSQKKFSLAKIFSGIKKMPSRQTLRLVSAEARVVEKYFPCAVDFGMTAIKLIQMGIIDKKRQIVNLIIEEFPPELRANPLERKRVLPEIFKKIIQEHKIKGEVITALPSSLLQMKKIKLSPMPLNEVYSAVKWEIKQTSTVPLEELSLDYYFLDETDEARANPSNELELMVITCLKKEVLERLAILQGADLFPIAIDVDSFSAVSSLVNTLQIKKEEVVLFLEFGFYSCSLNIVMNNQICFKRELVVNGDSLTQAILKQCNVSYEEAERLKVTMGLIEMSNSGPDESAIIVNEAIWLHLENLIQDIDYTFKYFAHQLSAGEVSKFDRVILSGGSANLRRFSSYLHDYLGVPTEIADPLKGIHFTPEIAAKFEDLSSISPRLSVAMGLAIRGLD